MPIYSYFTPFPPPTKIIPTFPYQVLRRCEAFGTWKCAHSRGPFFDAPGQGVLLPRYLFPFRLPSRVPAADPPSASCLYPTRTNTVLCRFRSLALETSRFRAVFCASGVVLSRSAPRGTIPSLWLSWIPGFAGRGRRRCEESCAWGFVSLRKLGYWGQTVQGQYLLYIPLPDCPSPWTLVA